MTDTAQGESPAETEVVSNDPIADAANAFKAYDAPPERPRGADGKFVSTQEIEAEGEAEEAEPNAESQDTAEVDEGQPEEAQPEPADLPTSWPAEMAETWQSLPVETQDFIVKRDAEMNAAVNAKFQEAANVRKANEAVIMEANQSRQSFLEAADAVLAALQPQYPPETMLDPRSADYNPDAYHLQMRRAHETTQFLTQTQQQRQTAIAQLTHQEEAKAMEQLAPLEEKFRPQLLQAVPQLGDPQQFHAAIAPIVQYAIENGIPAEVFQDPNQVKWVTSPQILMAWKAQQFDKMSAAKAKVQPKAPKPAAPPVRPGVTTSKSQVDAIQRKNVMERVKKEGSIEAGAAAFKLFMGK